MDRRLALATLWMLAALGVLAVFAIQLIERPGPPIGKPVVSKAFSPNGDGSVDTAQVRFRLKQRHTVTVGIVDDNGDVVRRLLQHARRKGDVTLTWNGHRDDGDRAATGTYFLRVTLDDTGKTFDVASPIRLDLTPPKIVSAAFDMSRLGSNRVVRANVDVRDAVDVWFELDGTRLPTVRVRRDKRHGLAYQQQHFLIAAKAPDRAVACVGRAPASCQPRGSLVFFVQDDAGNRASARYSATVGSGG